MFRRENDRLIDSLFNSKRVSPADGIFANPIPDAQLAKETEAKAFRSSF